MRGDHCAGPDGKIGEQALEEGILEHAPARLGNLGMVFGLGEQVAARPVFDVRLTFEQPIERRRVHRTSDFNTWATNSSIWACFISPM